MILVGRRGGCGVAMQASQSASSQGARRALIQESVRFLLGSAKVDRIGVWMEGVETDLSLDSVRPGFHGLVADRDGLATPLEWERLSPEAPLPLELLSAGKSVELNLNGAADQAMLGALIEIRRAVWVPLAIRGRLRGVLLAGSRKKHGTLPVQLLQSVSTELSVAVELDEQRRLAQHLQADLNVTKNFLDELAQSGRTDAILTRLVCSCTDCEPGGDGLGAVFAELRTHVTRGTPLNTSFDGDAERTASDGELNQRETDAQTSWRSGDRAWLAALQSHPLASIWERAKETHGTVSIRTGAGTPWPRGNVDRLVAISLEAAGETMGVLTAGFRHESSSHTATERLEVRAGLVRAALLLRERSQQSRLQEARLRVLLRANSGATILVDRDGTIVGLTGGARELLGEAEEGLQESRVHGCGDSSSSRKPQREFTSLFRLREQRRVEAWLRSVQIGAQTAGGIDEGAPSVELRSGGHARLRCDHPGGGLIAVLLEPLPATHAAPLPRHDTDSQLLHVIEWLDEGVILFDTHDSIQAMNSRFAQIAGIAPEEIVSITTLHDLIGHLADRAAEPEKFAKRWRDLARCVDSGKREEIQLVRPVSRVLERTTRRVLSAKGRPAGRVEIYRDLSVERVFQFKLAQSEKLAALGQMVTGVAHELSNPLTSILGYAQRWFLRSQADGQSDEVRQIFQEAERASTIVRQLLVNARESQPERRRVSLNQVVSRIIDLQRVTLAAEKVIIKLDLDAALPFILGDAGQLQQVLMNLVGNARQAIEQSGRGGTIRISTRSASSGRLVQLEVSDDGPGIPEAIAPRIFDPFFTTKPAGIGTGLGLAIVLSVVREHRGQVKVAPSPAGGALFCVEFPAEPASQSRAPAVTPFQGWANHDPLKVRPWPTTAQPLAVGTAAAPSQTIARVLVVEDEPTVARLITDVLEDEGFQVDALSDGYDALDRAARESYDLVVCDMKMPGLDGQHFYETLASTGNPLWKRFLFVTGDVLSSHTQEFLERHQLPHVAKPFRVEELTKKVHLMLSEDRPTRAPGELAARTFVSGM